MSITQKKLFITSGCLFALIIVAGCYLIVSEARTRLLSQAELARLSTADESDATVDSRYTEGGGVSRNTPMMEEYLKSIHAAYLAEPNGASKVYVLRDGKIYFVANQNVANESGLKQIIDADAKSFTVLYEAGEHDAYAKDVHHAYFFDRTLQGVDAASFEPIVYFGKEGNSTFFKDKNYLYKWNDGKTEFAQVPNADPATFTLIPSTRMTGNGEANYAKDKNQFYCQGNVSVIDPATAVVHPIEDTNTGGVNDEYITDKNGQYSGTCVKK